MQESIISAKDCDDLRELALMNQMSLKPKNFSSVQTAANVYASGSILGLGSDVKGEILSLSRTTYTNLENNDPNIQEWENFVIKRDGPNNEGRVIEALKKEIKCRPLIDHRILGSLEHEVFQEILAEYRKATIRAITPSVCELKRDDVSLSVAKWRDAVGQNLMFVHGVAHARQTFDKTIKALSKKYPITAYDMRGHGQSTHNASGVYSHAEFSDDMAAVLNQEVRSPAVIVGSSISALHALTVAAHNPEKVMGLVLIDLLPDISEATLETLKKVFRSRDFSSIGQIARLYDFFNRVMPEDMAMQELVHSTTQKPNGSWDFKFDGKNILPIVTADAIAGFQQDARNINCPVLFIRGGLSKLVPDDSVEKFKSYLNPNLNFTQYDVPSELHCPWQTQPQEVADVINAFVRSI